MIDINYINKIPDQTTNILHRPIDCNLTNLLSNHCSENEFDNLLLNSNLNNYNIIK